MMKKKIVIIATTITSIEVFFNSHIKKLTENYDVTIISNLKDINILKENDANNIKLINLKMLRGYSFFLDIINLFYLIYLIKKENYFLTLSFTPKAGFLNCIASFICRIKIRIHIFTGQVWITKSGLEKIFLKHIDKFISYLSTNILADSHSQRSTLIENKIVNQLKIEVLGNGSICGVNLNIYKKENKIRNYIRSQNGIQEDALVILFLGRINQDKGVIDLLNSFELILEKMKNDKIYLLLVGPQEIKIKNFIKKNLNDNIKILPFTSNPAHYMSASDIFCLPSYREGFGMSAIEASSCNLPVVCSRIYGLTDAVEENVTGLMHEPGNVDQIAQCLIKLIKNKQLRLEMGQNGRDRVIKYFDSNESSQLIFDYINNHFIKKAKIKLAIVASTIMSVQLFLIPQINLLKQKYDILIISNLKNFDQFDKKYFQNCKLIHVNINRGIKFFSDIISLFILIYIFIIYKPKISFSLTPKGGFISSIASFLSITPIRIHWFGGQVWSNKVGVFRYILKLTDKIISQLSTELLTECKSQLNFLLKNKIVNQNKIKILGNGSISGVNNSIFFKDSSKRNLIRNKYYIYDDAIVILYLGRLNQEKGVYDLIDAFNTIQIQSYDLKLFIVGPDEDKIEYNIQKNLNDNIKILPFTSNPAHYMSASDIFCLPSYREGFGMSAIEASSCNLPVVCSRIYGLTDAVEENVTGLMHEPGNVDQIAQCLIKLIKNKQLRLEMGQNGRDRVIKYFDQKVVVNNFVSFINNYE